MNAIIKKEDGNVSLPAEQPPSRRSFLQWAAGGSAAAFVGAAGLPFATLQTAMAQNMPAPTTPDAALKEMVDGNARYASGKLTSPDHDLKLLREHNEEKQEPFAAVLSCADSRVPVEWIFDQTIGHIFVTRVAGNMVTPEIIASLEYGALVLGVKVILVMAHSHCGAVKATIAAKDVPGQISALYQHIQPAVDQAGPDVEATARANAKIQAALLRESSTVIAGLMKEDKVKVVAAYYDIVSGKVTLL